MKNKQFKDFTKKNKPQSQRQKRVSNIMMQIVTEFFRTGKSGTDPLFHKGSITITKITMSPDLKILDCYFLPTLTYYKSNQLNLDNSSNSQNSDNKDSEEGISDIVNMNSVDSIDNVDNINNISTKDVKKALENSKFALKTFLASSNVSLKFIPHINFREDHSYQIEQEINSLFDKL